jgi:hypothetical protein
VKPTKQKIIWCLITMFMYIFPIKNGHKGWIMEVSHTFRQTHKTCRIAWRFSSTRFQTWRDLLRCMRWVNLLSCWLRGRALAAWIMSTKVITSLSPGSKRSSNISAVPKTSQNPCWMGDDCRGLYSVHFHDRKPFRSNPVMEQVNLIGIAYQPTSNQCWHEQCSKPL